MMKIKERRKPFLNKVAFISGATRGIGLAIAEKLAERGANIVFTYLRSRSDAAAAQKHLESYGVKVSPHRANMGSEEMVRGVFDEIKKEYGALDFLIHNAATGDLKAALEISLDEWQRSQDINVRSLLLSAQLAAPLMEGRHGKILSISSHGSERCLPHYSAVGVAKSGIECLSRYLAVEFAPKNISVNVIMAGTTETQSLKKIPRHEEMLDLAKSKTPVGRIGHPSDIANVAVFLCSEESKWIVGQTIVADGGYSLLA